MSFKVIYASEVYEDLQNAIDFYNSRRKGLGTQFFETVRNKISQIKSNAYGFQVRYNGIRCITLHKGSIYHSLQSSFRNKNDNNYCNFL